MDIKPLPSPFTGELCLGAVERRKCGKEQSIINSRTYTSKRELDLFIP
jgi:hypothetical protein